MPSVLVVGSAEQSHGGVAQVIRTIKKMPIWQAYHCYWLGTQIQRNYAWKLWYAIKANIMALLIIWRYDIVHFHTVPDRIGLIIQMPVLLLAKMGGKKIIMQIHMGNQLVHHTHNRLFKWCLRQANLIILLAKKWERLFLDYYADVDVPTKVLYNACPAVPEVSEAEKENIILMAAYYNDNKAPDLLLKAWQKIGNKYPDWKICMLGNGEVERFRRMADDIGLSGSVTFTGYLEGKEKEHFFRQARILCMCSYEEGFPMVVLEAWQYGICVVTTPVGGLPDVLEENRNALIFDFGDWQQLADSLERLFNDTVLRQQMTTYSRHFVEETFSPEQINKQLTDIYRVVFCND